ncbi:MAG: TIGR04086 family membrane protein [Lachnospiraceae bacterium]|nr:TIGR04086 family membrane protein [Lachnospiraceae bacterium]
MKNYERVISLLKGILLAYIVTGIMLLVMAFLLYKFNLSETVVDIGILICYVISALIAGMCYAINAKSRKFAWGMLAGFAYYAILLVISVGVEADFQLLSTSCVTTLFICIGSGMLGGMLR